MVSDAEQEHSIHHSHGTWYATPVGMQSQRGGRAFLATLTEDSYVIASAWADELALRYHLHRVQVGTASRREMAAGTITPEPYTGDDPREVFYLFTRETPEQRYHTVECTCPLCQPSPKEESRI